MKILSVIIAVILISSCSTNINKDPSDDHGNSKAVDNSRAALEHFINGQILDSQEKYSDALVEFEKALEYEKSSGIYYALAVDYLRINKLYRAKESASKAIQKDSLNNEYIFLLASIYENAKSADSAAVCYELILKRDSLDIRANLNLAEIYKIPKPRKALEIFKKLARILGPTPEVLFEIASINEHLGNSQQTIETLLELLKLNPSDLPLKKILIETYIKAKENDKALKLIDDLLVTYPLDFSLIEYKGGILVQLGKWDEAKNEYMKIIESTDIRYITKIKIGMAFLAQSQTDSLAANVAKNIFETVDKDTTDWQVKFYLAEINFIKKNDSLAMDYYKDAAKLADWNVDIWTRYGGLLFDKGKFPVLKTEMEKAIKIFPDNYQINLLYGLSLAQLNEHLKAKEFLKKAITINPSDIMALYSFGFSLNQLKEEEEALKYLNQALNIDPDNIQILGIAGMIYENRKDFEQSDKLYKRALAIDSADATILNNYAYSLSERGIDLDKALNMAKIAVSKDPKNSSFLDTIGWIYFKLGNLKEAQKYVEEAVKYGEQSVAIYDHLGDIYSKLNKNESAVDYWNKALKKDPDSERIKLKIKKGLK